MNLLALSAADAHMTLDDYARHYPAIVGSHRYRTVSESELASLYREWRRWQRQQPCLLGGLSWDEVPNVV